MKEMCRNMLPSYRRLSLLLLVHIIAIGMVTVYKRLGSIAGIVNLLGNQPASL